MTTVVDLSADFTSSGTLDHAAPTLLTYGLRPTTLEETDISTTGKYLIELNGEYNIDLNITAEALNERLTGNDMKTQLKNWISVPVGYVVSEFIMGAITKSENFDFPAYLAKYNASTIVPITRVNLYINYAVTVHNADTDRDEIQHKRVLFIMVPALEQPIS